MSNTFKPNTAPQNLRPIGQISSNRFIEDSYAPAPTISQSLEEITTINTTPSNQSLNNITGLGNEVNTQSVKPTLYSTNISLKKDVYSCKGAREELDEEFTEFNILNTNYKKFFDLHNRYFYAISSSYQQEFLDRSTSYVGNFVNPRIEEINTLQAEIDKIQTQIDSIEKHHPYIKNGQVIASINYKDELSISAAINQGNIYYVQSSRIRKINNPSVYRALKNQLGEGADPETLQVNDLSFIIFVDSLVGFPTGPEINEFDDIYETPPGSFTDDIILYLNRYVSTSNPLESTGDDVRPT